MRRYDPELGEALCELVSNGCGLKSAAEKVGIPRRSARAWEASVPEFAAALGAARREYLEDLAEELVALADAVENCTDTARVQAQRLRIDTRRWVLRKLRPERYGDHLQLTGAGNDPLIPAVASEVPLPRLMGVLSVLLPPGTSNRELYDLANRLQSKLNGAESVQLTSGSEDGEGN
jgi:hypothetical protein